MSLTKAEIKENASILIESSDLNLMKRTIVKRMACELCQYKDAEEGLGVDLLILSEAFKNGIWSKGGYYSSCRLDNEPTFIPPDELEMGHDVYTQYDKDDGKYENKVCEQNALCLYQHYYEDIIYAVRVKDYDITWALTKEELL